MNKGRKGKAHPAHGSPRRKRRESGPSGRIAGAPDCELYAARDTGTGAIMGVLVMRDRRPLIFIRTTKIDCAIDDAVRVARKPALIAKLAPQARFGMTDLRRCATIGSYVNIPYFVFHFVYQPVNRSGRIVAMSDGMDFASFSFLKHGAEVECKFWAFKMLEDRHEWLDKKSGVPTARDVRKPVSHTNAQRSAAA